MSVLYIILGLTNIFVIGCMHFAYQKYGKYTDNMILGVTFSGEQMQDSEIQEVIMQYNAAFKKTIIAGYVTAVISLIPFAWYLSIGIMIYMVWMFGYIFLIQHVYIKYHKKIYSVKKEKGYTYGKVVNQITIDTKLSLAKDKMPVSPLWFIPSFFVVLLPFGSSSYRQSLCSDIDVAVIFYSTIILVKVMYLMMYYLFARRRSVVYSQDSEINIVCNRITKRGFSIIFTAACLVDSISFLLLLWDEMALEYVSKVSIILFMLLQTGIVAGMLFAMYEIKKKRSEILANDTSETVVDEDEFWASGFYNNPLDNRLFVEDRQNSMNLGMNMAKKSAWILTSTFIAGTFVLLIWLFIVLLRLDFVETRYEVKDNFQIIAPSYSKTIEFDEIQSMKLLEELPNVKMSKQNGAATDQYALGKFRIRNEGTCYLYIYYGFSPVVELQLEDMKIYFNSKEDGVVQKCYQELQQKIQQSE